MDKRTVRKTDRFAQLVGGGGHAGGRRCRHRHRRRRGADRLLDRHRHRRPEDRRRSPTRKLFEAGPDRLNPFWVTALIAEHGRRRGVDGARHARPAHDRVHRVRRVGACRSETPCCSSARAWPTRCWRAASRRRSCRSAWAASARCGRCRGGNDDPEGASRPFDSGRDGFILAEGGAVLVLEELERARVARRPHLRRGARATACRRDAHHVTEPDPVGDESGPGDDDGAMVDAGSRPT